MPQNDAQGLAIVEFYMKNLMRKCDGNPYALTGTYKIAIVSDRESNLSRDNENLQ